MNNMSTETEKMDTTTSGNPKRDQYEGFIASDDIGYDNSGGQSVTLIIKSVAEPYTVTDSRGVVVESPVVYFEKAKKGLVLNKTNERICRLLCGKRYADWNGKEITLGVRFVNAFGERDVPVIRVVPPSGIPLPFGVRKWTGKERPSCK